MVDVKTELSCKIFLTHKPIDRKDSRHNSGRLSVIVCYARAEFYMSNHLKDSNIHFVTFQTNFADIFITHKVNTVYDVYVDRTHYKKCTVVC